MSDGRPNAELDSADQVPTGAGNGFPAPPKCLHKSGRFGGSRVEPRGVDEAVESAAHQQFDQKSARSRQFGNCYRLGATPGASTILVWREPVAAAPRLRSAGSLRLAPLAPASPGRSVSLASLARSASQPCS